MSSRLAAQLADIRKAAKLSQAELAAKIGISRPALTQIEGGKATTTRVIEAWAKACAVEIRLAPEQPPLVELVLSLREGDQLLVEQLAKMLPAIDDADRRTLVLLFEGWTKYDRSEESQGIVKRRANSSS